MHTLRTNLLPRAEVWQALTPDSFLSRNGCAMGHLDLENGFIKESPCTSALAAARSTRAS